MNNNDFLNYHHWIDDDNDNEYWECHPIMSGHERKKIGWFFFGKDVWNSCLKWNTFPIEMKMKMMTTTAAASGFNDIDLDG